MKIIIAGSRDTPESEYNSILMMAQFANFNITEVVCGKARGMDTIGERWARDRTIPVKEFPADWNKYGKRAGYLRNEEMGAYADGALIWIYNNSRGSSNMRDIMKRLKKPYLVIADGVVQ